MPFTGGTKGPAPEGPEKWDSGRAARGTAPPPISPCTTCGAFEERREVKADIIF